MRLNLAACGEKFRNGNYTNYTYEGPIHGILKHAVPRPKLITHQGCHELCGQGSDYYPWPDVSATITTWVLPVIGLLLQAPFESNANGNNLLALARWMGNPIASIAYVLWNIKITGKCAMMVDMATPYEEYPGENSNFAQMRDSLFILSVMNQYLIRQDLIEQDGVATAAEKLLRIALFSDELPMRTQANLTDRRRKLAGTIRAFRKRGEIPVFVSTLVVLVAFAVSIESAFGNRGTGESAYDLALGLLLPFPLIFILSCVVDRNTVAPGRIRLKLNCLLKSVRDVLLDETLRHTYGERIDSRPNFFKWVEVLRDERFDCFFTAFAGQGRIRWHYGVAHPLLCSFEDSFMAEDGRGWLSEDNANRARTFMRDHRDEDHQFTWFDFQMVRQIASSICVFGASAGGAFILSYYTPTFGLGCRSRGYLIYIVTAIFLFLVEMLCWGVRSSSLEHPIRDHLPHDPITLILRYISRVLNRANAGKSMRAGRRHARELCEWWEHSKWTDHVDWSLKVIEVANLIWLVYIITAQTLGSYDSCDCISSIWPGGGGYTDFEDVSYYRLHGITHYWGTSTGLSCFVLLVGLIYTVAEYCTQSHLATEDFRKASEGIKFSRRFKKYTSWFRSLLGLWDKILLLIWRIVCAPWHRRTGRQPTAFPKTLAWDWKVKENSAARAPMGGLAHWSRRRSSTQPLVNRSQDERSSRDSWTLERSDYDRPENQTNNLEQYSPQ